MRRYVFIALILLIVAGVVRAQDQTTLTPFFPDPTATFSPDIQAPDQVTARLTTSNDRPLTGEPFTLTLTVELPPDLTLYELPEIGDQLGDFEIRSRSEVTQDARADGGQIYRQTFEAVLWVPGDVIVPELFVRYGFGGDDASIIPVRTEFFTVPTVIDFNDQTLRPMREPIWLPVLPAWIYALPVGVIAFIVALLSQRSQPEPEFNDELEPMTLTPFERLNALQGGEVSARERVSASAECLRAFIVERFDIPAHDLTTDELGQALDNVIDTSLKDQAVQILTQADLIKFAGQDVDDELSLRLLQMTRRWMQQYREVANA